MEIDKSEESVDNLGKPKRKGHAVRKRTIVMVLAVLVAGSMIATAALVPYLSNTVTTTVTVSSPMKVGISEGRESWATAQCYRPAVNIPAYPPPGAEISDWPYCSCDVDAALNWGTSPTYINKADCEADAQSKCTGDCVWYETGGRENNTPYTGGMVDAFPEGVDEHGALIQDWAWSNWEQTEASLKIDDIHGGETITIYTMSKNLANAEIKGIKELIVESSGITCGDFASVKVRTDSIYGELGYGKQYPRPDSANPLELCNFIDYNHVKFLSPCGLKGHPDTWGVGETDVSQWTITFMPNAVGTYTITYRVIPETT